MKLINLSLILALFISFNSFGQKFVKSTVKEATIFSNQAQITRTQSVKLSKGENLVKFVGLERGILANSIQVSGNNGITIISVNNRVEATDKKSQSPEVKSLLDSLKIIQRNESLGREYVRNLTAEKNMIMYNKSASGKDGFNVDNMFDLAQYYRINLNKIDALKYDKNQELTKLRADRNSINIKLRELGYEANTSVMNVTIISDKSQTVSMKLVYVVNNIGWTPFYEIKTDGIGSTVKAICKAKIYQNSQVDWSNVKLSLSTTTPTNFGAVPTVHPWVLKFRNNQRRYKSKGKAQQSSSYGWQSNSSYPQVAESVSYEKSLSLKNYTTATNHIVSRQFDIALPYSIKGRNGKAVVELEDFELKADYLYYAAPKYNCNVFLIANITDWEQYNLLPGTASLFLEGSYVGNTFINPNETSDTMSLVLGKDESIIIKREKIKDLTSRTLIGGKKKIDMGIQITVKNKKKVDIELILEDQVPITSNEKIEVNVKNVSGAKREESTGRLTWKQTIKSNESKVYKIRYEVRHPKNQPLENF